MGRRFCAYTVGLVAFALVVSPATTAAPGDPDPSFDADGVAHPGGGDAWGLAIQPDGRIVVGGEQGCGEDGSDAGAARLLANGALDASFSEDGIACHDSGYYVYEETWDAVLQPDGKFVLAGHWRDQSRYADHRLVRLLPDGNLDPSFGSGGRASADVTGTTDIAFGVALQPDGKFVLAGYGGNGNDPLVARYNADGSLDRSFGSNGAVQVAVDGRFKDVVIQPDGKIVAVGSQQVYRRYVLAVRLLPNGALDPEFGSGGRTAIEAGGSEYSGAGVALQPDGKIVVTGGGEDPAGGIAFATYRLHANGQPDESFGSGGAVITRLATAEPGTSNHFAEAEAVAIQQNGKLVVAGGARQYSNGYTDFPTLVRYLPDGRLDLGFGNEGRVYGQPGLAMFDAVALQQDGKIVASARHAFGVARYEGDPAPDGAPAVVDPGGQAAIGAEHDAGGSTDRVPPRAALGLRRQTLRRALRKGYVATGSSTEAGAVALEVFVTGRAARAVGGRKARRVRVARGVKTLTSAGRSRVVAKFSRRTRSKLRRRRSLPITVRLTARDSAGNASRATKRTRLRR